MAIHDYDSDSDSDDSTTQGAFTQPGHREDTHIFPLRRSVRNPTNTGPIMRVLFEELPTDFWVPLNNISPPIRGAK